VLVADAPIRRQSALVRPQPLVELCQPAVERAAAGSRRCVDDVVRLAGLTDAHGLEPAPLGELAQLLTDLLMRCVPEEPQGSLPESDPSPLNFGSGGNTGSKAWKDTWGCGQGIGAVEGVVITLVDVSELDCEFYACSAHKMVGPTGIGMLYGKAGYLNKMPPFMGGGDMILSVTFEKTTYSSLPYKFEAGTPNIAGAIGMGAGIDFLESIGMDRIAAYEQELTRYGIELLESIDGIRMVGTARDRAGVLSFTMENAHPHDIGQIFSDCGVAIRAGHHCAQPVMDRFGVPSTARASLALYNTRDDIDRLVRAIHTVKELFA